MKGRHWERPNIWISQWRQYKSGKREYNRRKVTSHEYSGLPYEKSWFEKVDSEQYYISEKLVSDFSADLNFVKGKGDTAVAVINDYMRKIRAEIVSQTFEKINGLYMEAIYNADEDKDIPLTADDYRMLNEIKMRVFSDINASIVKLNDEVLHDYFNGADSITLLEKIKSRAELVFKTAMSSSYNLIKANRYRIIERIEGKKGLYRWVNPMDDKTTPICRELVYKTADGVTMDELINLVREVAEKYNKGFWHAGNPLYPHFNCRSTIKKVY